MKKILLTVLVGLGCGFAAMGTSSAQSTNFIYDNGTGTPASGSYAPGSSFTFSVDLSFTSGGAINDLEGLSYWFQQNENAPYPFSITLRDVTGSPFSDLQSPALSYPQVLDPISRNADGSTSFTDEGGLIPAGDPGLPSGMYHVADITFSIDASAAPGVYHIQNVVTGGRTAFIFNDQGTGFRIPAAIYTVTVVPEPTTTALSVLGVGALLIFGLRRRAVRS